MKHLESLTIHRFRGMEEMSFEGFGDVNVFVGKNDSGKTSSLEAIALMCAPGAIDHWRSVATIRLNALAEYQNERIYNQNQSEIALLDFFPHPKGTSDLAIKANFGSIVINTVASYQLEYSSTHKVTVRVEEEGKGRPTVMSSRSGGNLSYELLTTPDFHTIQPKPNWFISPYERLSINNSKDVYSKVIEAGKKDYLLKTLQIIDDGILQIEYVPSRNDEGFVLKNAKFGFMPLRFYGGGISQVFIYNIGVAYAANGIILIDEVETSLHTEALIETFQWLIRACQEAKIQLFLSTHSLEALDALLDATRESDSDFIVYRLNQLTEKHKVIRFDREETERIRNEMGLEMR